LIANYFLFSIANALLPNGILLNKRPMRLLLSLSIFLMVSCTDRERPCTPSPSPVLFRIVSGTGADLLNASNTGAYDTTNIKMYSSLSSAEHRLIVQANATADSFFVYTAIYQNWKNADQYFLKLPNGDIDTISTTQTLVNKSCGTYELLSLSYNNVELTPGRLVNTSYGPVTGYTIVK
jgi:hypothetical protein